MKSNLQYDFLIDIQNDYKTIKSKKKKFSQRYYNMGVLEVENVFSERRSKTQFCVFDSHLKKMFCFDLKKLYKDYFENNESFVQVGGIKFRFSKETENDIRDAYMNEYYSF